MCVFRVVPELYLDNKREIAIIKVMKKGALVAVAVAILLVIGAGAYLASKHRAPVMQPSMQVQKQSPSPLFSSIQDALSNKALSLRCDFTDANGERVVAYIKNGAILADVIVNTPQESGSVLMMNKKIYFWNASTGMMMDMPNMTVTPTPGASTSQTQSAVADLEKYKESCKQAVVADSLFVLPTNVKFTDESQVMNSMPTSAVGPTGGYAVPTQYQQYIPH